ncbi:MAG: hypothetical protein ACI4J0_12480 [Huintestinicola sp.]|uniref:hypothetical protein n=1 Tax=Huintestinicola sp. TaxID=2981661 RepID=UPI003EFD57B2
MNWKKTVNRLLYPRGWGMILLTVISTAALIVIFVKGYDSHPVAYFVYVLSAYTLTVDCIFLAKVIPQKYRSAKKMVCDHPIGGRFMNDPKFKTHVTLYCSLGINVLYAAANMLSGILYRSVWSVTLSVYYFILAVMRFLLVRFVERIGIGNDRLRELKSYRLCGMILLTLNIALSGVVILVIVKNKSFEYAGMLIFVMAAYTFYITAAAVVNLVKYRKYNSPVMSAAKVINFAAALVSMLSLETAMLSRFGEENNSENFDRIMTGATGAGVLIIISSVSVYMMVRSTKEIGKLQNNNSKT